MNSSLHSKSAFNRWTATRHAETILVVDDHACLRDIASIILGRCGYRVLTTANAEEATTLARQHAGIDLLLTELDMPGISGEELARWFQANRADVQVVFMSGDHLRLHSLAPRWAVVKPFIHIDVLIQTIREALAHSPMALLNTQIAA